MALGVGVEFLVPLRPLWWLGHRQIEKRFADAAPTPGLQPATEKTPGGENHCPRLDHQGAAVVGELEAGAVVGKRQRGHLLLGDQGHSPLRQHPMEHLAQADAGHRRRHGRDLEDLKTGELLHLGQHLVGAKHAEDRRKPDNPYFSCRPFQHLGQLLAIAGDLERSGHGLGIEFSMDGPGKVDPYRRKPRPAGAESGHQLAAAEALEAVKIDNPTGASGGHGAGASGHGGW